jgi:bidirectional [NiFe] hydrogenase diaphorase subunit
MDLRDLERITDKERAGRRPVQIRVCTASGCLSSDAEPVRRDIASAVSAAGLTDRVDVCAVGCMRLCGAGPLVRVDPHAALYRDVQVGQGRSIVESLDGHGADLPRVSLDDTFFTRQHVRVLENCGTIEPERIEAYIAAGGYQALFHALHEMTPADVVNAITRSGLRGRGGAGYPTGVKWATVAKMPSGPRYLVCNADEGDPGAFMDRTILASDPHCVLEGMAIAAYAVGAEQGFIYVRGEYPLAIERLDIAIRQAGRLRLLGNQIFDSRFNFRVDLRIGAGAYVCGEETALIASIEGQRGTPRPRPPYPAEAGLWGHPTLINNVETLANVPAIVRHGADWFASIGTAGSKGTKVFALTGRVRHTGLVEVPMGTSVRTIVEDVGGGVPDGGVIKAVQTGGPSGGCIPAEHLDTPVDYESLQALGSIMGSGGMIVMDQDTSMVDMAKFFMGFCRDESCGKCVPCRAGTVQMDRLLARFSAGEATRRDLERLETLCDVVKHTSLCGLGQAAPNPVLSTLRYFRHEYLARLRAPANGAGAPARIPAPGRVAP